MTARPDLSGRRLYLCTADRRDLVQFLQDCITGGVDVVQLRDKNLPAPQLIARARVAAAVCRDHGVPFVLNDRPDLALEVDADGVHVGQDDAPVSLARRILGPNAIVGLSTHSVSDLERSFGEEVTYISAGPVEATPTKPGRPGTGLAYVTQASARASVPVFVTGGVTPDRIPSLVAGGARNFVVVRHLTQAPNARRAARELREAIDRALSTAPQEA